MSIRIQEYPVIKPTAIEIVSKAVTAHIAAHESKSVVFLEGLEYLVTQSGFPLVLNLLQHVQRKLEPYNGTFVVSADPGAFPESQYASLKRMFEIVKPGKEPSVVAGSTLYEEDRAKRSLQYVADQIAAGKSVISFARNGRVLETIGDKTKAQNNGSSAYRLAQI